MVLAGAGSGKTRVITRRIARLVGDGAQPARIVGLTFTNKAAGELRARVAALLGSEPKGLFLGTFHAWGLRFLRIHCELAGLAREFVVHDRSDQLGLLEKCLKELGVDPEKLPPAKALAALSRARGRLEPVPEYGLLYERRLRATGGVDFDDLLLLPLKLLRDRADLRERVRPEHVLVDEFQDTSPAQSALLEVLWPTSGDVCVVGDEDQAIYGFRGATVQNILGFSAAHAAVRVVRLVRNYRSTGCILGSASSVVANNRGRLGKTLVAEGGAGERVSVVRCRSAEHEAEVVVARARVLLERFGPSEVAVLYRTNAQSRLLEEELIRRQTPYRLVKGQRFYERREVKDVLAYLRLLLNPNDDVAFDRVVNVPARGIGGAARDEIDRVAAAESESCFAAARRLSADGSAIGRRVGGFVDLVDRLRRQVDKLAVPELLRAVVTTTGYDRHLVKEAEVAAERRTDNIDELATKAAAGGFGIGVEALSAFLDEVTVSTEPDGAGGDAVSLMTLHNAKGLEFDGVIIAGLEEGLLPHASATGGWGDGGDGGDIEEERRLLYVGMTRARKQLVLTNCWGRRVWGEESRITEPSRFLAEIDPKYVVHEGEAVAAPTTVRERPSGRPEVTRGPAFRPAARTAATTPVTRLTTTGATATATEPFAKGAWVRHKTYGDGMIIEREGSGDALKLTVRFSSALRKKLVAKFAGLVELKRKG